MGDEEIRHELLDLLTRHQDVVARLQDLEFAQNRREAMVLRVRNLTLQSQIMAFRPQNRQEAFRKVEHFAQVLVAGIDVAPTTIEHVLKTVARFIS